MEIRVGGGVMKGRGTRDHETGRKEVRKRGGGGIKGVRREWDMGDMRGAWGTKGDRK